MEPDFTETENTDIGNLMVANDQDEYKEASYRGVSIEELRLTKDPVYKQQRIQEKQARLQRKQEKLQEKQARLQAKNAEQGRKAARFGQVIDSLIRK
jgi:hypothetical protein